MRIQIIAKTRAKKISVVQLTNTVYEVSVNTPPIGGKANLAIIATLADYFNVKKNQIRITSGFTSQNKIAEILK